jgi:hypothetical protein
MNRSDSRAVPVRVTSQTHFSTDRIAVFLQLLSFLIFIDFSNPDLQLSLYFTQHHAMKAVEVSL